VARNAVAFEVPSGIDPRAKEAGAYWFMYKLDTSQKPWVQTTDRLGIGHACPCGCGMQGCIWFRDGSMNGSGRNPDHEWDVTGEWPKVTLAPSIGFGRLKAGGYHWHGFLEDGVFVER